MKDTRESDLSWVMGGSAKTEASGKLGEELSSGPPGDSLGEQSLGSDELGERSFDGNVARRLGSLAEGGLMEEVISRQQQQQQQQQQQHSSASKCQVRSKCQVPGPWV
jgi:hypothetical protein